MKLVKYLFVLGSGIFAACGSPQQPIASPTPQEEIIDNIDRKKDWKRGVPDFNQRILHNVFRFLPVESNAKGQPEEFVLQRQNTNKFGSALVCKRIHHSSFFTLH